MANSGRSVRSRGRPSPERFDEDGDDSRKKRNYLKHYSDNGTKKRNLTKSKIGRELRKIKTNFETEKSKLDENRFRHYFSRHNRNCIFVLFKIKVGTGGN